MRDRGRSHGRIDPFLAAAGARLSDYSLAIRTALTHHGEIGSGHEKVLAEELKKLLPQRIAIKTGSVIGAGGTVSRQLDLVIYDESNYPTFTYVAGDLILPDSVLAVISVKTSLRLHELPTYFREAAEFKTLMAQALGRSWAGFYAVIAFCADGTEQLLTDRFHAGVFSRPQRGMGVDLIAAIDRGPVCLDLAILGEPAGEPPRFLAHRAHVPGIATDACIVEADQPFVDVYKLMVRALDPRLSRIVDLAAPPPGLEQPEGVSRDPAYHATFAGKSDDLLMVRGAAGNFQIFYANTGGATWVRGTPTESFLVLAGPREHVTAGGVWRSRWLSDDTYCAQTQDVVAPGQLVSYSFDLVVPGDARLGDYRFYARPAIAGIGALTRETRANGVTVVEPEQLSAIIAARAGGRDAGA